MQDPSPRCRCRCSPRSGPNFLLCAAPFCPLTFPFSSPPDRIESPVAQTAPGSDYGVYGRKNALGQRFVDGSEILQMRGIDLHVRSLHCEPNAPPSSLDFSHSTMRSVHT
jgi:hypothetical protein